MTNLGMRNNGVPAWLHLVTLYQLHSPLSVGRTLDRSLLPRMIKRWQRLLTYLSRDVDTARAIESVFLLEMPTLSHAYLEEAPSGLYILSLGWAVGEDRSDLPATFAFIEQVMDSFELQLTRASAVKRIVHYQRARVARVSLNLRRPKDDDYDNETLRGLGIKPPGDRS